MKNKALIIIPLLLFSIDSYCQIYIELNTGYSNPLNLPNNLDYINSYNRNSYETFYIINDKTETYSITYKNTNFKQGTGVFLSPSLGFRYNKWLDFGCMVHYSTNDFSFINKYTKINNKDITIINDSISIYGSNNSTVKYSAIKYGLMPYLTLSYNVNKFSISSLIGISLMKEALNRTETTDIYQVTNNYIETTYYKAQTILIEKHKNNGIKLYPYYGLKFGYQLSNRIKVYYGMFYSKNIFTPDNRKQISIKSKTYLPTENLTYEDNLIKDKSTRLEELKYNLSCIDFSIGIRYTFAKKE